MAGIIIRQGENTLQAAASANEAAASANEAEAYSAAAQAGVENFFATLANGVAGTAVNGFFASAESGSTRIYKRTGTSPFYVDQGDAAAPVTKALLAAFGGSLSASNFHTSGNSGTIGMQDNTASIMAYNVTGSGGITNTLRFITGAAERMRITSTGFVGLNTSAPADRLDVNGRVRSRGSLGINASPPSDFWGTDASANASLFTSYGNIGSQGSFGFDITANGYRNSSGTWTTLNTNGSTSVAQIRLATGDGSIIFGSDATKAPGSSFAVTERMRITSAGNVGINEPAPDYKLDVNGTFGFTPGSSVTPVDNGDVVFELTNNTTLTIKAKGSDGVVRSATITLA